MILLGGWASQNYTQNTDSAKSVGVHTLEAAMSKRSPVAPVLLSLFLTVVLLPGWAAGAPVPPYLRQWGTAGSGNGQFDHPYGVAVDAHRNIYVTDTGNNRIQKFDSVGTYLTQWGSLGTGNGEFNGPMGIHEIVLAGDLDGNAVYVVDSGNNRIQEFDSTGTYLRQWGTYGSGNGQFRHPSGLAVGAGGKIYVADRDNNRIQVFDKTGTYLTQWGTLGTGNGQFDHPLGVYEDICGQPLARHVYVVDSGNNRIQKFDSTGTYLTQWGTLGSGNGQFDHPLGIHEIVLNGDLDGNAVICVADSGNNRVQVFDNTGTYLTQWGTYGSGNGQFDHPMGIHEIVLNGDLDGNAVYVVDSGNNRIQMFGPLDLTDSLFAAKTDYGTGAAPFAVAVGDLNGDAKPDLVTANEYSNTVSVLLGNGDGTFGAKTDFGTGDQPYSVAIGDVNGDTKADLAVANYFSNTVSVLLGNGDGTFGAKTDYGTGAGPICVAFADVNGDWYADLALTCRNANAVSVLLGNGDGTFGPKTDYPAGDLPVFLAVGDVNGDAKLDLAVANFTSPGTVSVLLGNGNGTFGAKTDYATGDLPCSVAIGDVNGDTKRDLAVSIRSSNTVSVLLNNGGGTFGPKTDYGTGDLPCSVGIGDVNGDWVPDLAVANALDNTVSVRLGVRDNTGSFGPRTDFATGDYPRSMAFADVNGDTKTDLVVANAFANTVSVLLNISTGTTSVDPTPSAPPRTFQLLASRPNPSRGTSEIRYVLPSACTVEVALFDLAGRKVRSFVSGERSTPGEHSIRWDGRDDSGVPVCNGVYLVQVRAGGEVGVRKLVVLH